MNSPFTSSTKYLTRPSLWYAVGFLIIAHLAGVIGLSWPVSRPYFQLATPFNLLISAVLLLLFHRQWNSYFIIFLCISFLLGYGVEVIGVHTEVVFGTYWYGDTLGWKIADVPIVIGVNWFILAYSIGSICDQLPVKRIGKSLMAAFCMVALDYFIEPVAVFLDFWQWEAGQIPLQNYLGWLAVAWLMQLLFFYLPIHRKNSLAPYMVAVQWTFFLLLSSIVV